MTYKILEPCDQEKLLAFEKGIHLSEPDIWVHSFDEEAFLNNMQTIDLSDRSSNFIIGAFNSENEMVGRCDVIKYRSLMEFTYSAYIDWLYVDINYRKKGVGTELIRTAVDYIEKSGVSYTYLFTASNKDSLTFYSKLPDFTLRDMQVAYKYSDNGVRH